MVFCLECALRHVEKQKSCRGLKLMYRYDEVSACRGPCPMQPLCSGVPSVQAARGPAEDGHCVTCPCFL